MKIKINVEIDCELWFDDKPTNQKLKSFLQNHLFTDAAVIGIDEEDKQEMININSIKIQEINIA